MTTLQSQAVDDSDVSRIELTGCQDVRVAAELHRKLIELLASNHSSTVDCTNVDSFDAAALQLLLAAKTETAEMLSIVAPENGEAASWFHLSGLKDKLVPAMETK